MRVEDPSYPGSRQSPKAKLKPSPGKNQVELPHPRDNSNYYDRIMTQGGYCPIRKDIRSNAQVPQYTYEEWHNLALSPQA